MADLKEQQVSIMFCSKLQENSTATIKILKLTSVEQTMGRIQVFECSSMLKSCVSSVEGAECLDIHHQADHMNMWSMSRIMFMETEESLSMKLLTFWEYHLGHFRVF